jgi:hypothetical protein
MVEYDSEFSNKNVLKFIRISVIFQKTRDKESFLKVSIKFDFLTLSYKRFSFRF